MKTILFCLSFLLSISAFAAPVPVADTSEVKPFILTIDVDRGEQILLSYQNADAAVQITLLEAEAGIVYVERVEQTDYLHRFDPQNLPAGNYTLLVEYDGKTINTHRFVLD
ncbi:MAG: hypothetical protein ACFCUI_12330 [Bernardetiaceae bacterium]